MDNPLYVPAPYITGTPTTMESSPKDSRPSSKGWRIVPADLVEVPYVEVRLVPRDSQVTPTLVGEVAVTGAPSFTVKFMRDESSPTWTPFTEGGSTKVFHFLLHQIYIHIHSLRTVIQY